jgi:hypothetical protein
MPTFTDRARRLLPSSLAGLAGVDCAACCALPVLLAAGVLSGAGWAVAVAWLPGVAVVLAGAPPAAATLYTATGDYRQVLVTVGGLCLLATAGILARAGSPAPAGQAVAVRPSRTATGTDSTYITKP